MAISFAQMQRESPGIFTEACPSRTVLDHVTSKWGVLVLLSLTDGTRRWGELRRSVDGISEKMLATTLRTLAADGIVERTSYPEVPPRVEYSLTPLGVELMERVMPLMTWIQANAEEIVSR